MTYEWLYTFNSPLFFSQKKSGRKEKGRKVPESGKFSLSSLKFLLARGISEEISKHSLRLIYAAFLTIAGESIKSTNSQQYKNHCHY